MKQYLLKTNAYHKCVWKLAKFGWRLISIWIEAQHHVDGDYIQVHEIINEWLPEIESFN